MEEACMKKPIVVLLVCFLASIALSLVSLWTIADMGDRMLRQAIENAPKYAGMLGSERVYIHETEKGVYLEFQE
jgi:hypothetical protein